MTNIPAITTDGPQLDRTTSGVDTAIAAPHKGVTPTDAGATSGGAQVALSPRAELASALLQGVVLSEDPTADPQVERLRQTVASKAYQPQAKSIAKALLAFERRIARKMDRG